MAGQKTFLLVLIKASHYDDEGYVIQWIRSAIPSNTLAVLHALAQDCADRKVLGDEVEIAIEAYDETNTVIPIKTLIRKIKSAERGMVALVGVQSNEFPRAVDLAAPFIDARIPVVIGGFHVSGCLAMFSEIPPDLQTALGNGISLFAGEAEGRLGEVLRDACNGRLKPTYNYMSEMPKLEGAPPPFLPANIIRNTFRRLSSFDAGRGCPFQCSFCTIINVQGRTSRWRSADDIEALIRANLKQGVRFFFITDDDFARNKNWEAILDRLIKLREGERLPISFTIQVDTRCHKIPRFIEKAARAGCRNIFIGLENINPESLVGAKKRQNKVWEYRQMVQDWKDHGCQTAAAYIIGFPTDTPESIARDVEIIKREIPVDLLEFFCLTPLPGCEDHLNLQRRGVWMDPDMNKYDLEHITTTHPLMSAEDWRRAYQTAWKQYYTPAHIETVLRRAGAKGLNLNKVMFRLLWFYGCIHFEGVHPLQGGIFRRKVRTMRRSGMPVESPFVFYPRRIWEVLWTGIRWGISAWQFHRIRQRVEEDPKMREYLDLALMPVSDGHEEELDLLKVFAERIPLLRPEKTAPTSAK